jgi:hypothetical protein
VRTHWLKITTLASGCSKSETPAEQAEVEGGEARNDEESR